MYGISDEDTNFHVKHMSETKDSIKYIQRCGAR